GRAVEFAQFFIDRIPVAVGERRRVPVAARRIGIEVAADEPVFLDAAFELGDDGLRLDAGRLRQLADADEVIREKLGNAVDHLVGGLRPFERSLVVTYIVAHTGSARREDRDVGAALLLLLELIALYRFPDLVVGDLELRPRRQRLLVVHSCDLLLAVALQA